MAFYIFHFLGVNLCSHIYYCLVNFCRQNPVIIPWGRTIPPCRFRKRFKFKIYRIDQHSDLQKASFYFITTLLTTDNGPFLPAKFHWNLTFRPNSRKLKQKVLLDAFSFKMKCAPTPHLVCIWHTQNSSWLQLPWALHTHLMTNDTENTYRKEYLSLICSCASWSTSFIF